MPIAASRPVAEHELVDQAQTATTALDALLADAVRKVRDKVVVEGRVVGRIFDREQRATHGLAWLATYVEAVRQLAAYAERMTAKNALGELEEHLVRIGLGEFIAQIAGGIPISQGEIVRPSDFGLTVAQVAARFNPTVETLVATGNTAERRARVIELMKSTSWRDRRRCRPRRHAGIDPRGNAQVRRQRGDRPRTRLASHQQLYPDGSHRADVGPRRVRADHSGRVWRHGAGQGVDVRRLRGTLARLYRRRLPRHPQRDRCGAHPRRRHAGAKGEVAAQTCLWRSAADGGVHRAQHRFRSWLR